jgi:NADH dehydrogenase [ubiquinone] 1 alpha subcomplex assembly factor 7
VRQFVRTETGWRERLVGLDASGRLAFGLAPDALPAGLLPRWAHGAGPGELVEVSPARDAIAQAVGARLAMMSGAALIIDYGHVRSGPCDTLQAVRAHGFADVLESPGDSDITSHVDFEALGAALQQGGTVVHGPLTQGAFLSAMGLAERAEMLERHADPGARADIGAAATRLAADSQMGQLFKVIAATHPDLPPPYPFQDHGQ